MTHPLTDEMCDALKETWGGIGFSHHDMRAAYDKGDADRLEQVIEWLKDYTKTVEFLYHPHYIMIEFEKAMRPQEDNQ